MGRSSKRPTKNRALVIVLVLVMLVVCVGVMLYPLLSTWYFNQSRSKIQTQYEEMIAENSVEDLAAIRDAAVSYNEKFYNGEIDLLSVDSFGYMNQLKVRGTDVIARIRIPCINVDLPVYHTDHDNVLRVGAGHLEQSSLPVGGENTHTVISAHSGMASAEMFSNLERMAVGDIFFIDVLGETLTYEVYSVNVVSPKEIRSVSIEPGMDLATLITCTPYGVNTHRLLVTGRRIETPMVMDESGNIIPDVDFGDARNSGSVWLEHYLMALAIGIVFAILFVGCCVVVMKIRKKKREQSRIKWSVKNYVAKDGDKHA